VGSYEPVQAVFTGETIGGIITGRKKGITKGGGGRRTDSTSMADSMKREREGAKTKNPLLRRLLRGERRGGSRLSKGEGFREIQGFYLSGSTLEEREEFGQNAKEVSLTWVNWVVRLGKGYSVLKVEVGKRGKRVSLCLTD